MSRSKPQADEGIQKSPLYSEMPSTINPEKLEFKRFSEMQREEPKNETGRILLYIFLVVVFGVGAALVVRSVILNNNQSESDTTALSTKNGVKNNDIIIDDYTLNIVTKPESEAKNVAQNLEYKDSPALVLGDSTIDPSKVFLKKIEYTRYSTFSRTKFNFEAEGNKLPIINIEYSSTGRSITVLLNSKLTVSEGLKKVKKVDSFLKSIEFLSDKNSFKLNVSEAFKYRIYFDSGSLVLDLKSIEEINKVSNSQGSNTNTNNPSSSTPVSSPVTANENRPSAPFYVNKFSQNTQYISSNVSGNVILQDNYWAWDEGSFFEISFGKSNMLGENYIPNAKAYYSKSITDKPVIILEISNLSQAVLSTKKVLTAADIQAATGISSLGNANFVKIELKEFKDGTAKYEIELKRKSDFKLLTQKTYDSTTQIVSLQIKD
ncbi:hypothetical protein D6810_00860 [Candidatus Dojkabacteria bacterium]|uniref:Uncharacterized protein n=1 Tax=Candidatus Dojkabacteria bacterium TaxID=2099670 RepID=A0A3M0Z123_9BACT|nr:MAG: hypothetical protein D6810_00860 [Candidatus Dojkabacteria bacterium]